MMGVQGSVWERRDAEEGTPQKWVLMRQKDVWMCGKRVYVESGRKHIMSETQLSVIHSTGREHYYTCSTGMEHY